jgi:surface protein
MGYMFYGDNKLSSFDLSSFDTSNVTNYALMFASVSLIDELDISNFNVKYSAYIYAMFSSMSNLKTIYVGSGWKFNQYDDDVIVFIGSSNLVGGAGTAYNSSHADSTYARVDGGASKPGYLTLKTN